MLKAGEAGIVGIGRVAGTAAGEPRRARREVHLDHVRDEDAGDVGAARFDARNVRLEDDQVEQLRQLGVLGVLAEEDVVERRRRAAVEILVRDRDEAFAEERVALARDLDPVAAALGLELSVEQDGNALAARRRVDAGDLPVATELVDGMASAIRCRLNPPCASLPGLRSCSRSKIAWMSA